MDKAKIEEAIDNGGMQVRAIIQLVGKPKEHIETALKDFLVRIKEMPETGFTIIEETYHDAVPQEDTDSMFSTFCDVDVVCNSAQALTTFCFEAMPSSVEITEPEQIMFRSHDMTDMMNDFISRMHEIDMIAKKTTQEARLHSQSLGIMIQNTILILLNLGPRDAAGIAQKTGVAEDQIGRFLDKLIDDGKIKEKDGKYGLVAKPNKQD